MNPQAAGLLVLCVLLIECGAALASEATGSTVELREAVEQARSAHESSALANALRRLAGHFAEQQQFEQALPLLQEALAVDRASGDALGEAADSNNLGNVLIELDRPEEALPLLDAAIEKARIVGDRSIEHAATMNQGRACFALGRYAEADASWKRQRALREELGDEHLGAWLTEVGNRFWEADQYALAADWYREALELSRTSGDPAQLAVDLTNLANARWGLDDYAGAEALYREALDVRRRIDDRSGTAQDLRNLGLVLRQQERLDEAIVALEEAASIRRELGEPAPERRALRTLADLYMDQEQYERALDAYTRSREIAHTLGDASAEGWDLNGIGMALRGLGRNEEALASLAAALALFGEAGDTEGAAAVEYNLGASEYALDRYVEALAHFERALALREQRGEADAAATLARDVGKCLFRLTRYAEAREAYERALAFARERGDAATEMLAVSGLGDVALRLNDYDAALEHYERALAIDRERGADAQIPDDLARLAGAYAESGNSQRALELYAEALAGCRQQADAQCESSTLADRGNVYRALGRSDDALADLERARQMARARGDRVLESRALGGIGAVYIDRGRYAEALEVEQQVLAVDRALGDRQSESIVLNNLGSIYVALNQRDRALEYFEQSLAIKRAIGDRAGEANQLNNQGSILLQRDRYQDAITRFEQALAIFRELGRRPGEATTLLNLATAYSMSGDAARASPLFKEAFDLQLALEDVDGGTLTLLNLGEMLNDGGASSEALGYLDDGLYVQADVGTPDAMWRLWNSRRRTLQALGRPAEAVFAGKQAVNIVQSLRGSSAGLERALRKSLLIDKRHVYEELADLLIELGRLPEAQQVLTMLKEDELRDFVQGGADGGATSSAAAFTRLERAWDARYRETCTHFAKLSRDYKELLAVPEAARTAEQRERFAALKTGYEATYDVFTRFLGELRDAFAAAPPVTGTDFDAPEATTLGELPATLARMGSGVAVVQYLIRPDRLRLLVTTQDGVSARGSVVGRDELERMITQLRAQLQSTARDPRPLAARLHALVIAPARDLLETSRVSTLMLAPDGALRYVPFAALHDGTHWLAEDYTLALYTPAERRRLLEPPTSDWRVAGFGVAEAAQGFDALPTVREELDAIVREGGRDRRGVLPGEVHLDAAFDAATLSAALKRGASVLHVASHFRFAPGTEADSFLLLGGGAHLSLADFRRGDFPLATIDFLALSACETAVGASDADGREVEGFGALAQQKGARSVLATLWPVADVSTGLFMQTLYAEHGRAGGGKAAALRATQIAFITGSSGGTGARAGVRGARREGSDDAAGAPQWVPDPDAPFAHPFYWAPFILMGNWL